VLRGLNIGVAIMGVDGIDADGGLTTHDEIEAQTNAALLERAQRVFVVADGSKVGRVQLARIATADAITELITDASADPAAVARLRSKGVAVTVVSTGRLATGQLSSGGASVHALHVRDSAVGGTA
jgi:DeoR family transcriptional regulator, aga operon transcriptional repressor